MKTTNTTTNRKENQKSSIGKATILFLLIFFPLVPISCSDEDEEPRVCTELKPEEVISVDAPETAMVNEPVQVEVQFEVMNSCGEFNGFVESGTETERVIAVQAIYDGCNCNQVIETITETYQFIPVEAGEYELRFASGETEFITAKLTVTAE